MGDNNTSDQPFIFLGLADCIRESGKPFPFQPVNIYELAIAKRHIIYPANISENYWVFLINTEQIIQSKQEFRIVIETEKGDKIGSASLELKDHYDASNCEPIINADSITGSNINTGKMELLSNVNWNLFYFQMDTVLSYPTSCIVNLETDNTKNKLGFIQFQYTKHNELSVEDVKAIESDPYSIKALRYRLGCKFCDAELWVYSAVVKNKKLENKGDVYHKDVDDDFKCKCGKTQYSLRFLKESMQGLLGRDSKLVENLNYEKRYAYIEVRKLVEDYFSLINDKDDEKSVQDFLEENTLLLCGYHAKQIFFRPKILGKFIADFGIIDSKNQLILIEIERPSIKLFKQNGHMTADLTHAYEQVNEWLYEYDKSKDAFLECFSVDRSKISTVKGVVIAGRESNTNSEHLKRHLTQGKERNVEFLLLDDLGKITLQVSRELN